MCAVIAFFLVLQRPQPTLNRQTAEPLREQRPSSHASSQRRIYLASVLHSHSPSHDAAFRARLALLEPWVNGFIVAAVPRTARGLRLPSPSPLPPGCWDNRNASRCLAAELPPLPHGLQHNASGARTWERQALLSWLGKWRSSGEHSWARGTNDVVLVCAPTVLPHPDALQALQVALEFPVALRGGPQFVYHTGWVAAGGMGEADERVKAAGGCDIGDAGSEAWLLDVLANTATRSWGCAVAVLESTGSATLSLFGGTRALAMARAQSPASSAHWNSSSLDVATAAKSFMFPLVRSFGVSAKIALGEDVRNGATLLATTELSSQRGATAALAAASFVSLLSAALLVPPHNSSFLCLLHGIDCFVDAAPPPRLHYACIEGRLGNYFINLLNAIALASAARRVPILPAYTAQGAITRSAFAEQFQYSGQWLAAPAEESGIAEFLRGFETGVRAICFASDVSGDLKGCSSTSNNEWLRRLGELECSEKVSAGAALRPSHPLEDPPQLRILGLHSAELVNIASHPVGVLGAALPPVFLASQLPLLQDFNFYGYSFGSVDEWEGTRCAIDFSPPILAAAWRFAGPEGPLHGERFFALHARLEDFSYSFPGEDTAPPLSVFVAHAARLAKAAGLARVFIATNGTPEERALAMSFLRGAGLEAVVHPASAEPGPDGALLDAAIAGHASGFLGNKQSTFSWLVGHSMLCGGADKSAVNFFSAAVAAAAAAAANTTS